MSRIKKISEALEQGTRTTISLEDNMFDSVCLEFLKLIKTNDCQGRFVKEDNKMTILRVVLSNKTICFVREKELVKEIQGNYE